MKDPDRDAQVTPESFSVHAPTMREERPLRKHIVLEAFLVLLFFASTILTIVYLGSISVVPETQAAAVAAVPQDFFAELAIEGKAAYVADLTTHAALYAKYADVQLPLASLAKVILVLVVTEVLEPESTITIPIHTPPDGGIKRFPDGSTWLAQDIIDFTLINSSNEGAEILADATEPRLRAKYPDAGEGSAVLWRMNALARELELTHTYFLNASGLDISATQAGAYGSARDTAKLFTYANEANPRTFEGTAREGRRLVSLEGDRATARNTDKSLGEIPGLIMGKTGTTDLAGGNLAVIFDIGLAHPIVAVVLGSGDAERYSDMLAIIKAVQKTIAQ